MEINPEKSKIVNLKTNYSEFLGFKIKAVEKKKNGSIKYVTKTKMLDKEKVRIKENIRGIIKDICNDNTPKSMYKLNSMIIGIHNYYRIATMVSEDFGNIEHCLYKHLRFKFRRLAKNEGTFSETYDKFYGKYKRRKQYFIHGIAMYPISGVTFSKPIIFNKKICNYTKVGREMIHQRLEFANRYILAHVMNNPIPYRSLEYNDNRISLFSAQQGRCAVTGLDLSIGNMHCHHKIPKSKGGTDEYKNLIFLIDDIHLLIHSNKPTTQRRILNQYNIDKKMLDKVNKLRNLVGNYNITDCKLAV